ncbi:hypothetical protein LV457_08475 [Mycobacterium sp. MYCO198283]|uniref:hypothetical protein n=1 Tax=Mycobacterium sp. MYCO198283 TaxID=2883505 RepID=UPI001E358A4D|nr:hypothetical protein [Mycobacterium sp. MYCO198283]MCG5432328.1 hypothetical protein [Mycobacterium sp. MYCO198283]
MTTPSRRPRSVTVAFALWLVAAVLLVALGLLLVSPQHPVPWLIRGFGGLWIATGFALAYLAGKAYRGDGRHRRAAVALVVTVSVLLVLFTPTYLSLLITVLAMVGAIVIHRAGASEWFAAPVTEGDGGG